jgi:protein-L-isoaspartate(D-aspartate) O-methyltransferase
VVLDGQGSDDSLTDPDGVPQEKPLSFHWSQEAGPWVVLRTEVSSEVSLAQEAEARFKQLKLSNITQLVADGSKGWPKQAPFERIIVTAAAKQVPQALLDQLAVGGIMIVPVEEKPGKQDLYRITRGETGYDREHLLPVRFVPLVEGVAKEM